MNNQTTIFDFGIDDIKENLMVSFSGGRTSAYMCYLLKRDFSHKYNLFFVYANTGMEHENTLIFVDKVDKWLNLDLVWVEASIQPDGIGTSYLITSFKDATRDNSLFKDMSKKYGLANQNYPHCTRELKISPMDKWANQNIRGGHIKALGLRIDEPKRLTPKYRVINLSDISSFVKSDILSFWREQSFDLDLEEKYGNCVTCFKKSDNKLKEIAKENPHYFDGFMELEELYGIHKKRKKEIQIYRGYRKAIDFKNDGMDCVFDDIGCDECGSVILEEGTI